MSVYAAVPAALILTLLPALAMAQKAPRWTVGALGVASTSPFEAEAGSPKDENEVKLTGFPYVAYRGDKFFLDGTGIGAHMAGGPTSQSPVTADILVSARMRPGASRHKVRADAGVRLGYDSPYGAFALTYLHDVTDASNGSEITAAYTYAINRGRWSVSPGISLIRQSAGMATYLWGVTQAEHDSKAMRGKTVLPVYGLSKSIINVDANISASYQLSGGLALIAYGSITRLDRDIRRNPGVDEDYVGNLAIGAAYSF